MTSDIKENERGKMTNKIWFANMLRGFAALLVVYRHLFETYWLNKEFNGNLIGDKNFTYPNHLSDNIFVKFASFTWESFHLSWGTIGVGLFFLISGFVISFSISKRTPFNFAINRILRIYPVVFIAIFLDIVVLYLYNYFYLDNHLYTVDLKNAFFNATLILRILNNSVFLDPVLWTLEIEFFFYIVVCITKSKIQNYKAFLYIFYIILILTFLLPLIKNNNFYLSNVLLFIKNSLPHISLMFIGVYFYNLYIKNWNFNLRFILIFSSLIVIQYTYNLYLGTIFSFHISSYFISLLIWMGIYILQNKLHYNRILNFFASISYSLYLSHQLFGYILITILLKWFNSYYSSFLSFLACIILGGGIWLFIERQSIKWSKKF